MIKLGRKKLFTGSTTPRPETPFDLWLMLTCVRFLVANLLVFQAEQPSCSGVYSVKRQKAARADKTHQLALINVTIPQIHTPAEDVGPGKRADVLRDVPIYLPTFAGTKLCCSVSEATGCEEPIMQRHLGRSRARVNDLRLAKTVRHNHQATCKNNLYRMWQSLSLAYDRCHELNFTPHRQIIFYT